MNLLNTIHGGGDFRRLKKSLTPLGKLEKIVCEFTDTSSKTLRLRSRKREVVQPRQLMCYFAKKLQLGSLTKVGNYLGGFNHATVLHSANKIEELLSFDKETIRLVEQINFKL